MDVRAVVGVISVLSSLIMGAVSTFGPSLRGLVVASPVLSQMTFHYFASFSQSTPNVKPYSYLRGMLFSNLLEQNLSLFNFLFAGGPASILFSFSPFTHGRSSINT